VGLRPLVAADQRRRAHLDLVRGGGHRLRRQADERAVSRGAFLLYILFLQLASAHHLLPTRAVSTEWKVVNTSYFMYFAVLASMIHGLTMPGAMEVAQRAKGYNKGLFEWLRKAPWGNPVFSGVFISIIGFGFLGGISGVMMGTEQLNMIIHNTIYVPGHFHATVVVGTTLSFMALTYFLIPVLFKREMINPGWPSGSPTCSACRCTSSAWS
jgi:cytochrome c oxidase subunit 1